MVYNLSYITIVSDDVARLTTFYKDILQFDCIKTAKEMAVFSFQNIQLCLVSSSLFQTELGLKSQAGVSKNICSINVVSTIVVDNFFKKIPAKNVLKQPQWTEWKCYRGYFFDLENNYWEIVYNPNYTEA